MHRKIACLVFLLLASSIGAVSSPARATSLLFDWTATSGSGGGITASVSSTIQQGSVGALTHTASDPTYVAEFAASHSVFFWNVGASAPGHIDTSFVFSAALPTGARLILLDLDVTHETAILTSGGSPLVLLEQLESIAGQSSLFPSYDPLTGELVAVRPNASGLNDNEASVFDVSGLSSLDVGFRNGNANSGIGLALALPVPEPGSAALVAFGLGSLALRRRSRLRRAP